MSYAPKYQDYSDFLRSKRITATTNANKAADPIKFRVLTAFDSYDPSLVEQTGIVTNDYNRKDIKLHNTFLASQYRGSKIPYFK